MPKCKISEVSTLDDGKDHPIMIHFENGHLNQKGAKNMDCVLAKDMEDNEARKILLATEDNVYTGKVNNNETNLLQNFIAIHNKVTNKIRLIEFEECSVLSQHYDDVVQKKPKSLVHSKEQARSILLSQFGSKRANRLLEKTEKMKMNIDVVKEQLDKTMNSTTVGEDELDEFDMTQIDREQHLKSMFPPLNKEATNVADVYQLTDLIDREFLDRLNDEAANVLKTDLAEIPIETKYILEKIERVQLSKEPDSEENLTIVKTCIYLDGLINFVQLMKKMGRYKAMGSESFSQITEKVETHIRAKFANADSQKYMQTNYTKHKSICYIILLSLMISDKYEIDMNHIIQAINTSKSNLLKLAMVIPVRQKTKTNFIQLKLPSQVRQPSQFVRKRRTL